ncbi:MAG: ribonuclease HII [Clostridia bacterium]|nr:ribonuclease HII [Clostridia bacterium]
MKKTEEKPDLWKYEYEAFADGFETVCGVDEAGRGPLAGPVCAAAVILPPDCEIEGLNDSKKLTDKKRRELYDVITEKAVSYGIAFASHEEIDEINILQATYLAMERAMEQLAKKPDLALIDGNRAKDFGLPVRTIVKGDSLSASIAAASILAKVTRDRYMEQMDAQYPQYGFAVHKGYGTKRHYAAIKEAGISPIHRRTFLKNLDEK